ncbi:lachesin-like [Phlebotomus argentipes]|uniref:lachesin-like n=1 Tax=Phlebotomus argentipes TaxID=94469 RepID=UPI002892AD76|nr:lachesin-like [Phlebotomus argentipes]
MNSQIVALLVILGVSLGQKTPSISSITPHQIKDAKESVDLQCSVLNLSDFPVIWKKKSQSGGIILSSGEYLIDRDSRYDILYDKSSSTFTLKIKDLEESDAGTYQCQILLSAVYQITAEVELQVRRASDKYSHNPTQSSESE